MAEIAFNAKVELNTFPPAFYSVDLRSHQGCLGGVSAIENPKYY